MGFVRQKLPAIPVPCIYAYEPPGSGFAVKAGAAYMLLEGFYDNTSPDVEYNICNLSVSMVISLYSTLLFICIFYYLSHGAKPSRAKKVKLTWV